MGGKTDDGASVAGEGEGARQMMVGGGSRQLASGRGVGRKPGAWANGQERRKRGQGEAQVSLEFLGEIQSIQARELQGGRKRKKCEFFVKSWVRIMFLKVNANKRITGGNVFTLSRLRRPR